MALKKKNVDNFNTQTDSAAWLHVGGAAMPGRRTKGTKKNELQTHTPDARNRNFPWYRKNPAAQVHRSATFARPAPAKEHPPDGHLGTLAPGTWLLVLSVLNRPTSACA